MIRTVPVQQTVEKALEVSLRCGPSFFVSWLRRWGGRVGMIMLLFSCVGFCPGSQ